MLKFTQLNERGKTRAAQAFAKAADASLGIKGLDLGKVKVFLSQSNVHRFNNQGELIGKVKRQGNRKQFVPGNLF
ncbi:hypothetical protein D1B31_18340 [Neobacillus notoginsengisoli]|uniref:Uncharacterized protein n=1 Tax=Neobacillus notoginsengisoli TaxID=1578198 RepID=A0A417YQH6_9BACI|nr:hypothetical protein [Neobacillus notoginsengisoli]RHW36043.1 hypothetical protein D1B31_18340 [Neobacillus notoginsengisoli]